jgi:glycosyltransferase involved in cell wall biosynthesis
MTDRHVLVLNHFARPRHLPGGTRHVELFSRLKGWRARIIAGDRGLPGGDWYGREGQLEMVRTTPYSKNGVIRALNWASFAVTSFLRGVRCQPLDLVYGSSPHLLAALSGWSIAKVRRVPFVLEIRDVWPQVLVDMGTLRERSIVFRSLAFVERFVHRRAAHVVYMAEGVAEHLVELNVRPERMTFIPNGADPEDFMPSADRETLRARYGFTGVVAVYAGAHGPANGLDLLLDAARNLGPGAGVTVVLVGDGVDKPRLMERASTEDIENVRFLPPVPKREIPDLLAAADVGVHCLADVDLFRRGVSPNKLFDYMAAGLPAITNTPGVCGEYLEASGGGRSVGPTGIAEALAELAELSHDERVLLGCRGRAYLEATRSRTAMAARLQDVLDSLRPSTAVQPHQEKL